MKIIMFVIQRIDEWWTRTSWGWLVVLGPIVCYLSLSMGLDIVGLASNVDPKVEPYYRDFDASDRFRSDLELDMYSLTGRMEYALIGVSYVLIALFSILWAAPRIFARLRNPFGGVSGIAIAAALSVFLYMEFLNSDYNIRIAFADDVLRMAKSDADLADITLRVTPFGLTVFADSMSQDQMLAMVHRIVYALGGTAPWVLVVFMACVASFEPRSLGRESHRSLRERMTLLQIAVVLAAANIVLSIAYTRTMMAWPVKLFEQETAEIFLMAATRYSAIWGGIGTLMLITTLAPAYIALTRQFDRVAIHELTREGDDYVAYHERIEWRRRHGLLLSAQQALTTGVAVVAPLMTSPAIEATQERGSPPAYEQGIGTRP